MTLQPCVIAITMVKLVFTLSVQTYSQYVWIYDHSIRRLNVDVM